MERIIKILMERDHSSFVNICALFSSLITTIDFPQQSNSLSNSVGIPYECGVDEYDIFKYIKENENDLRHLNDEQKIF